MRNLSWTIPVHFVRLTASMTWVNDRWSDDHVGTVVVRIEQLYEDFGRYQTFKYEQWQSPATMYTLSYNGVFVVLLDLFRFDPKDMHSPWMGMGWYHLCSPLPVNNLWVGCQYSPSPGFCASSGSIWRSFTSFRTPSIHLSLSLPRGLFPPTFIVVTSFVTFVSSLLITWTYQERCFWWHICGHWLDNCIAPELSVSKSLFPCFTLNPLKQCLLCVGINVRTCSPLPILSLSRVDRHDLLYASLLYSMRALHISAVPSDNFTLCPNPSESEPSSRSLPSHLHFVIS